MCECVFFPLRAASGLSLASMGILLWDGGGIDPQGSASISSPSLRAGLFCALGFLSQPEPGMVSVTAAGLLQTTGFGALKQNGFSIWEKMGLSDKEEVA